MSQQLASFWIIAQDIKYILHNKELSSVKEDVERLLKKFANEAQINGIWLTEDVMSLYRIVRLLSDKTQELETTRVLDDLKKNEIFKEKISQILDNLLK